MPYLGMKCPFSRLLFSFVSVLHDFLLKTELVSRWFALLISPVFGLQFLPLIAHKKRSNRSRFEC